MDLLGREYEKEQLDRILSSKKSEFVTVYGRRRVGKTYLIRTHLKGKITLHVTGLKKGTKKQQIDNFYKGLLKIYKLKKQDTKSKDWVGVFNHLMEYLEQNNEQKKLIFLDELPWMSTAKSDFLLALEHFWNHWASGRNDIVLIISGSAASWVIKNILKDKGGLHNRVTQRMKLNPFSLRETEEYLIKQKFKLSRFEIVKLYMIFGGIPFYLSLLDPNKTIPQNIDELCFRKDGSLREEYNELYTSLFAKAVKHLKIVEALSTKMRGLTREEILKITKLSNGGTITEVLEELEESDFIVKYIPIGKKSRDMVYKITDFFTLFHLKFIAASNTFDKNVWTQGLQTPKQTIWAGFSFELVCFKHVDQIKKALGIQGINTSTSTWSNKDAQVDLIMQRADHVVNLYEIKYYIGPFTIDKSYYYKLLNKIAMLTNALPKKDAVHLVLLTTFGVAAGKYNDSVIQKVLNLDDLF